ncbi:MAG: class I SAM-dependent methyltransferase [bacterium]|nr:class I SAM-dependent methyltransferase [bacterium]
MIENEIAHGKKICPEAELVWGWGTPAGKLRAERRARFLINAGEITEGKKILEIGCGTGVFTEKIVRTGAEIIAIDISPELIERAREREVSSNVQFEVMNVEKMDFPDNNFDSVVGSSILHHLNLEKAFLEIKRVLKPEGRVAFAEPNMMNPQIMIQKNIKPIKRWLGDSPDETAFFRWSLKNRLQECGFGQILIEPFDFLHPFTPAPLIPIVDKVGQMAERLPILREIAGSLLIQAKLIK